ncbi:MAG: DUF6414 family protein [Clostridiales bacterium]|nr:DUF6414 family protein [Clostridiales bacterium]
MLSGANLNVEVEGSADISHKRERVARNILENTLLADFLSILESDDRKKKNKRCKGIEMFPNLTVHPEKDSFSYLMLVAPYLSMIDGQLQIEDNKSLKIDLAKVEQAINKGRGFYEFIGNVEGRKTIFRFNHTAFRNSYTMSDLPKMQLTYYAIKVGEITPEELKVEKEFEFGTIQRKRVIMNP